MHLLEGMLLRSVSCRQKGKSGHIVHCRRLLITATVVQVAWALIAVKNSGNVERRRAGTKIFEYIRRQAPAGSPARAVAEELPKLVDQLMACANLHFDKSLSVKYAPACGGPGSTLHVIRCV